MKTLIVVPARFGSTRFPGKPLTLIAGRSMVSRVAAMAGKAAQALEDATYVVATDDARIETHCSALGVPVVMTDPALPSGSDRALAAADALGVAPEIIVNLQGDSPFTPPSHVAAVAQAALSSGADAATPYVRLTWEALDALRAHKRETPFSGTTLVHDAGGRALWFSKIILPAIRKEAALRAAGPLSPVCRHIGLYAFRLAALRRYVSLPEGHYEQLEGLEQLRLLENGMSIQCVEVEPDPIAIPGIDTPEDVALAERLILQHGDPAEG
ncbi:3-deoxy-manno-octulosonate cytidylyltransferase [Hyphomonas johnsonii]|uniref:3-deoxy-manno-octulosonate cytidylyltransferase n=1 Tax=Hyphomonas johnsonii MHS-2 TaxID=1280950 RepID=A0A059FQS7_9PROT|nr:manno-octulosonate cytidylyltransferase [Hyphomonas johnsonii]KCZ92886.1 3-deoxy-manno-octulosonate cytidylyltransferase [Hyphomonas johnsonii MHS-2]